MVSASKAQKQTLNVPYCLNPSAHSIFFFQILDIIDVAEADDVPWQTSYFNKLCFQKKKSFALKFLQLKRREIPLCHLILEVGLDFLIVFVREASVSISRRPSVAEARAAGHLSGGTAFGSCRAVTAPVWGGSPTSTGGTVEEGSSPSTDLSSLSGTVHSSSKCEKWM